MGRMNRLTEIDRSRARVLAHWVPALSNTHTVNGAATATRTAAGNYYLRRTAAAANHDPWIEQRLSLGFSGFVTPDVALTAQGEVDRGPRITSFDVVYTITTEVANTVAFTFATAAYTDGGTQPTTTARAVTGTTLATTTTAYRKARLTVTTPFILDSNSELYMALRVDDTTGGNAVFDYMGLFINYDLLL